MAQNYKGPLDYIDVATRIVEFREKYPTGSLQQHDLQFIDFAGQSWVIYTAAAYRTPDDTRPGMGTAWEPVPGKTNFTRDSELQNAETAAWGRAIVAALAADTRKGIASAEEVRNRQSDASRQTQPIGVDPNTGELQYAARPTRDVTPKPALRVVRDWRADIAALTSKDAAYKLYNEARQAKAEPLIIDAIAEKGKSLE